MTHVHANSCQHACRLLTRNSLPSPLRFVSTLCALQLMRAQPLLHACTTPPCCKVLLLTATVGSERKLTIMEANPRSMTEAGAARTKENLPSPPRSGLLPPPSRLGVQGRTMCRRAPDPLPHARLRVLSCCRRADKHAVPCCARPCWLLPRCHSGAERVGFWLAGAGEGGMVAIQFKYLSDTRMHLLHAGSRTRGHLAAIQGAL